MPDIQHAAIASVVVQFLNLAATSLDDWTGTGSYYMWTIEGHDQAHTLVEQLRGLLGEPCREVLMDPSALKATAGLADRTPGVVLDREEEQ